MATHDWLLNQRGGVVFYCKNNDLFKTIITYFTGPNIGKLYYTREFWSNVPDDIESIGVAFRTINEHRNMHLEYEYHITYEILSYRLKKNQENENKIEELQVIDKYDFNRYELKSTVECDDLYRIYEQGNKGTWQDVVRRYGLIRNCPKCNAVIPRNLLDKMLDGKAVCTTCGWGSHRCDNGIDKGWKNMCNGLYAKTYKQGKVVMACQDCGKEKEKRNDQN